MKATTLDRATLADATSDVTSGWFAGVFARVRKTASDRALRRQLAEMDDALLRDIGIQEDEIARVRAFDSFTPRAWR